MGTLALYHKTHDLRELLIPAKAGKDKRSRLGKFVAWLEATGRDWNTPDLAVYRDAMLAGDLGTKYRSGSVNAHLATIRKRYRDLLKANSTREALYDQAGAMLREAGQEDNPANRAAIVNEALVRLENDVDPVHSEVKVTTQQDRADSELLRLTTDQANALLAAPGVDTLPKLRDTCVIALLLCTGLREAELSALEIQDLRQRLGGELALHVREGKGRKERLIPYGELAWVLAIVDKWTQAAHITSGPVVRAFYKGNRKLRPGRLSVRATEYLLADYPVMVDGELTTAKPHDCRRTYARRLYEAGVDLVAIQQNLGHTSLQTTLGYIGELDAGKRRPPAVYSFDLAALAKIEVQGAFDADV